jgi:hypothetical protein
MILKVRQREEGFSLIFVMSLGAIAVLAALALTDSLLPIYRNVAGQNYMNQASAAADSAAQYGIAYLNNAAATGALTAIPPSLTVPSTVTGTASATVYISPLTNPATTPDLFNSVIYNPQNANNLPNTSIPLNDYRVLTAVATYGPFTRGVRVILGPNAYVSSTMTPAPFLNMALFANSNLTITSGVNILTDPSVSTPSASIGSNNFISLGGGTIDGNITAFNSSPNPNTVSISAPSSTIVNGNVEYSNSAANTSGGSTPFTSDSAGGNVWGSDRSPQFISPAVAGEVNDSTPQSQASPTAPQISSAQPATFSLQQTGATTQTITVLNTTPTVPADLGDLNLSAGTTLVLPAGQYTTSSLIMDPTANIQMTNLGSSTGVQLYVQGQGTLASGSTTEATVVSLNGNITGNSAASNLQIFYNGAQGVQLATGGSSLYAVVYAPNADVTIDTTGGGTFHGAATGNTLEVTNNNPALPGTVSFNPSSINASGPGPGGAAPGPGYNLSNNASKLTDLTQSFNILSWLELLPTQIPPSMSP